MENRLSDDSQNRLDDLLRSKNRVGDYIVSVHWQGSNSRPFQVLSLLHSKTRKTMSVPVDDTTDEQTNPNWENKISEAMDNGDL